eukprot:6831723-Karenia_brevis.AAC.1
MATVFVLGAKMAPRPSKGKYSHLPKSPSIPRTPPGYAWVRPTRPHLEAKLAQVGTKLRSCWAQVSPSWAQDA